MNQTNATRREIAHRMFATEYQDSTYSYSESEEDRAPNYIISPTGQRANRLFIIGVVTEVEAVNEDTRRVRVVDPTGAFLLYAGQYQPDIVTLLDEIEIPSFVAVTGKTNTFQPDGSDEIITSIRPESVNTVTQETRDRWIINTAEHTLNRIDTFVSALNSKAQGEELQDELLAENINRDLAIGIPKAIQEYNTTKDYLAALRDIVIESVELVAGHRDNISDLTLAPHETKEGETSIEISADLPLTTDTIMASADEEAADKQQRSPTKTEQSQTKEGAETMGTEDVQQSADTAGSQAGQTNTDEMYELGEEERQEVKDEYGVEFKSGTEIDEKTSADESLETPDEEETMTE
ncbi:MAG: RPA family protein, partial [Halobacteriaceae archaeon]